MSLLEVAEKTSYVPVMMDGVQLLPFDSSSLEKRYLLMRGDGRRWHISEYLANVIQAIDGRLDTDGIATTVSDSLKRPVEREDIDRVLSGFLTTNAIVQPQVTAAWPGFSMAPVALSPGRPSSMIYAASGYSNLFKFNVNNGVFAPTAASTTQNFSVVFNQAATSATITPTGAQASQFSVSNNTCGTGGAAGSACTFTGTFQPTGVGLRTAAFAVADSLGNTATVSFSGVGQGSALTVDPGTLTQTGTGFSAAAGVAVDTAGNSYIADTSANAVYRYPAGGGARSSVGTGLVSPAGVAADGAGNVYIADLGGTATSKGRVVEVPVVSGVLSNAGQTVVATGLGAPKGVFVDGYGTLFVADSANARIFTLPPSQFGQTGGTTFGTGLTLPTDVVVDSAGNLYVADKTAGLVIKISSEGVQSQIGSGFSGPTGVALDASGSLFVADQGNQRVVRVPNEAGVLNATDQTTILTSIAAPYALRADANANLVVSDSTANVLYAVNRQIGAVSFPAVNVNTTSAAQSVTLSSSGNAGLALSSPLYTPPASPFALAQGKPACTAGTTVPAGYVCVLSATFSPTVKGPASTSVSFSTNAKCIFTPAVVTVIASSTVPPVTVPTYTTVLSIPVNQAPLVTPTAISPWAGALLLLLLLRVRRLPRSWRAVTGGLASLLLLLGMAAGVTGCGSATSNATPAGTSTVTVTATATPSVPATIATSNAGTVTSSFTLQLTVK